MRAVLADERALALGAALEAPGHPELGRVLESGVRVSADVEGSLAATELAIVFASPGGALAILRGAAACGRPCVVGTTGFDAAQREEIASLAGRIPVVLAANFSVAVNVLIHLVREAAQLLGEGFDAEIVELHHAAKVDAPSGTALRLGAAVAEGRGRPFDPDAVWVRKGETGPRPAHAIGIQALRGGDVAGEHSVLLVGRGERLELVHRSATRDPFAHGAVRAAHWVRDRPPGLYDMEQVLGLRETGAGHA